MQNKNLPANQCQFKFVVTGFPKDLFIVQRFSSENLALSQHYQYTIDLLAPYELKHDILCGKKAKLIVAWGNEQIYTHGIISHCQYLGPSLDREQAGYNITLASPLQYLAIRRSAHVFVDKSIVEIAQKLFQEINFPEFVVSFHLQNKSAQRELTLQLNENDLDFIERLLSQQGIYYTFLQEQTKCTLFLTDNHYSLPHFPDDSLPYYQHSGTYRPYESIFRMEAHSKISPTHIKLNSYYYPTPNENLEIDTTSYSSNAVKNTYYLYGNNYNNKINGEQLAKIYQQAFQCQAKTYTAASDCRGLTIGQSLQITNCPVVTQNNSFRIVAMSVEADQSSAFIAPTYIAKVHLIEATQPFRTALKHCSTFQHIIPAMIEGKDTQYPSLDNQGRYRIRFPFDQSNVSSFHTYYPVRALQSYGGLSNGQQSYGMHFPLRGGTQVAVAFINGNLDNPTIIGVITNVENTNPVTNKNITQCILRTWGGNELCFDDDQIRPSLMLATYNHKNFLKLDATKNQHQINLSSEEGYLHAKIQNNLTLQSNNGYLLRSRLDQLICVNNNQFVISNKSNFYHKSGRNILIKAEKNLLSECEENSIKLTAASDIQAHCNNDTSANISDENLFFHSMTGNIFLHSNNNLILHSDHNAEIIIGQPKHGICILDNGTINMQCSKILLDAPVINFYSLTQIN